jgi:intracellular multiplication protein IcmK
MKKIYLLCSLIGFIGIAIAADNPNDLQQLQALQQLPPNPSLRSPQLNTSPTTPPSFTTAEAAPVNTAAPLITQSNPNGNPIPNPLPPTGQTVPTATPVDSAAAAAAFNQQTAAAVQGTPLPPVFQAPFTPPTTVADSTINQTAFNNVVNSVLPMTPDQIHRLKQLFTASQYAQAAPPGIPPRPVATSQIVNLAPGATPPVIRLAQGFVTSLVFIDSTGEGWPIESYSIGDPQRFNIQWNKTDNTLMIQALSLYNYGNLAVRLRGLGTPVMLTLIPGQKDVDYRVDLRIQDHGPNAKQTIVGGEAAETAALLPRGASPILLSVLEGVPPPGSRELNVCGPDIQAWLLGCKLYVRTHFTILSPAWLATMSSADGTKAFEMQKTPMLLVSVHGKAIPIKIEGL